MKLNCWDCEHHKRKLVETERKHPLFFASYCDQDHEAMNADTCQDYTFAIAKPWTNDFTAKG